jgi:predicted 2-oxoglutarate/Fe(II)-dependent dioxygenase YbiX
MNSHPSQEPPPHIQFQDVLDSDAVSEVLQFVFDHQQELCPSGVVTATEDERPDEVRRSQTLMNCEPIWPYFEQTLVNVLPILRRELEIGHFPLDHIERQLTVHFNGDFFGPHNDSGAPHVASRRLTYVYYFNCQPKRFSGGELRLYHSIDEHGAKQRGTDFVTIEPIHNSIVFFPSWVHHEVLEVHTEADGLESARMTLTGWFHQPPASNAVDLDTLTELQRTRLPQFTSRGFEVKSTPSAVHDALVAAYEAGRANSVLEAPDPGVLPTGQPELTPIGELGSWVAEELRELHESWSGQSLLHTATYGIRTYRNGQTLRRHCDRFQTHVVSSIVHIGHEGEPWPLVIEDHDGQTHHIVLGAGEMLLYESATCPHARPEPFRGDRYSSVFVHFRPVEGWDIDEATLTASTDIT